jgi:YHS domain-containing protein
MEVDEATAQWTSEYKGQTYFFCAPGCKAAFDKDPEKYLDPNEGPDYQHH